MDQVEQVREKIDIVTLIGEYITLKKMGRNFSAPCPFHSEKTPSFVVSPERQIWHCFGCGLGGDCFTFLMQYEHTEFVEALRILAKRTGITLTRYAIDDSVTSAKEKIYVLNRLACEFYHYVLTQHSAGRMAYRYLLDDRKLKEQTIKTFMVGFAPSQGTSLVAYLTKKKGYKTQDSIDAGLATQRGDFFLRRIMFPLFDHRDNIVGFAGRALPDASAQSPKYINTRETLVYHKGDVFFGLNITKQAIKRENRVIIMEGEFDVILSFQEGISNVVAVKGTALTNRQVQLIARFASKVSVCFDQDRAGQEAIKRSLPVLEERGLITTVVVSPNAKDPDEAVREDPILFKRAVQKDVGVYDYLLEQEVKANDITTAEGKKKVADELLPILAKIGNEIIKEHYLKKLAQELNTSYESIVAQVDRLKQHEREKPRVDSEQERRPRKEVFEEYLLALIVQHKNPLVATNVVTDAIAGIAFGHPAYGRLFDYIRSIKQDRETIDNAVLTEYLPVELLPAYDTCYLFPLPSFPIESDYHKELLRVAKELRVLDLRAKIKELGQKIQGLEKSGHAENQNIALEVLRGEFSALVTTLQTVGEA